MLLDAPFFWRPLGPNQRLSPALINREISDWLGRECFDSTQAAFSELIKRIIISLCSLQTLSRGQRSSAEIIRLLYTGGRGHR